MPASTGQARHVGARTTQTPPINPNDIGMRWLYIIFGCIAIWWFFTLPAVRQALGTALSTSWRHVWGDRGNLERAMIVLLVFIVLMKYHVELSTYLDGVSEAIRADRLRLHDYNARNH